MSQFSICHSSRQLKTCSIVPCKDQCYLMYDNFSKKIIIGFTYLHKDDAEEQKFLWCIMWIIISVIMFSSGIIVLLIIHFCIVGRSLLRQPAENGVIVRSSRNGGARMSDKDLETPLFPVQGWRNRQRQNRRYLGMCCVFTKVQDRRKLQVADKMKPQFPCQMQWFMVGTDTILSNLSTALLSVQDWDNSSHTWSFSI